jgi:hypothetical protein
VEGQHCRSAIPRNRLIDHCKHVSRRSWRSVHARHRRALDLARAPSPSTRLQTRAPARVTLSIQTPDPARVSGPCGHKLDAVRRALHAKTGQRVQLHVRSPQSDKEAVFIVAAT